MEILNVNSSRGSLTVKWSNAELLAYYATPQRGCYFDNIDTVNWASVDKFTPLHNKHFHTMHQNIWAEREARSVFDVQDGATIIDIGCGAAVIDLLLYSYIPQSKFYLVDKEGEWPTTLTPIEVNYTEDHPFYHSWAVINDAIDTSNFDKTRFNFLTPADAFPVDADLIMSTASWCFHYSKDQYWEKVMESLKQGGKLFLDVRLLPNRDIIGEISEDLKCEPTLVPLPNLPAYLDVVPSINPTTLGYSCLWVNNK